MEKQEKEIDFVITWVDGNDRIWREQKAGYSPEKGNDDREERYRDWEQLHFWFRGVEKYAPWVRKIHLITWGHLPKWLNTRHPKLHIVRHEDYMPAEILPTFNSNVIELYMHRMEGLAEQFVYFNDDMFIIRDVEPEMFFKNGKPCDILAFQPVIANPYNPVMSHMYLNNALVLSKYFKKRENVLQHPGNYFHIGYPPMYFFYNVIEMAFPQYTGFFTAHNPSCFLKSMFEDLWEKEEEALKETAGNRFRSQQDLTQYLFREWQKLNNCFTPKNILKDFAYFNIDHENKKLLSVLKKQKAKVVCLNDANKEIEFERVKKEIADVFLSILPEKSAFEN